MKALSHLFANNRAWAGNILTDDPEFFRKLTRQQAPQYFWIGCSDSRVPRSSAFRPQERWAPAHQSAGANHEPPLIPDGFIGGVGP